MFFQKIKGLHINGRKELVKSNEVLEYLKPQYVYFPLKTNIIYNPTVNVGDFVKVGTVIANRADHFGHPVCSSVSGKVTGIKKMWHLSGKMVEMLEIENDFKDTFCDSSFKPSELTKEEVINSMKNSGLVGLGGGGFPTFAKYIDKNAEVLIINGAECEPYLTSDYAVMSNYSLKFLKGVSYMQIASNAKRVVIAIKKTKKELINKINKFINEVEEFNNFELCLLDDVYPAGYEKYIVQKVTKKTYDKLPISIGVIVNNAQTAYQLARIIEDNMPLVEKVVTISGEGLKNPCNVLVKIGTPINEVIEFAGGYHDNYVSGYFVAGGPLTGKGIMFDTLVVTANLSGVCALENTQKENNPNCLGCGKCASVCPMHLTPTEIKLALSHNDVPLLKRLNATKCIECGMCSYVCPSRIEITESVVKAKELVYKQGSNK